ncbi:hypothetical protein CN160_33465, partial [Sinorhizobium meliloti]
MLQLEFENALLFTLSFHVGPLCNKRCLNCNRLNDPHQLTRNRRGLSGILCGGPVSSVEEPLAKDDGELCLCLDPFP